MMIKKVLLIGVIAGAIETAIWYLLSDTKDKMKIMITLFILYTVAYVVVAQLERYIPEDDGVKYETALLPSFFEQ